VTYFSRKQLIETLEIEEDFLLSLEREEIVVADAPSADEFSEEMLERVRVAFNLVRELEVNLPGVSIILHMREQMADLRRQLDALAAASRARTGRG
jgi:hypothetical protein